MRIGIALPTAIAGAPASLLSPWACSADAGPFASLGVHDRLAYDSLEPLTALAAAAAVTTRLRLACLVAIAPLRSAAMLAKQAASVDALSGGRLTLGLGVGPRRDDYELAGVPYESRGRILDEELMALRPLWRQGVPSSARPQGPDLVLGGLSDRALVRLVRYADGYVHSGGPPRAFRSAADRVRTAWSDAGRPGRPHLWGMGYFALGPGAEEVGRAHLHHYYAFAGAFADRIAAGLLTTPAVIRDFALGYEEAGCDHLMLFPTVADLAQVDLLAEVAAIL
jgi:alkanesulfonate monooxygenase SsuD/methylene tetrahydromethanopterin reductase-like flavin-dependent oxidoreductase (luciferase family)